MAIQPRPILQPKCIEFCGMANSCKGVDPVSAVALAKHLADRPYGNCVSEEGPLIQDNGTERCLLYRDVQSALDGIATGMRIASGEILTIPLPLAGGEPKELAVTAQPQVQPMQQLDGYMRLNV